MVINTLNVILVSGLFMRNTAYNPLDLEYALNPKLVKPLKIKYWFASDDSFKRYNTYQLVEKLNKTYTHITRLA